MQDIAEYIYRQGYCIVDNYLDISCLNGLQAHVHSLYNNGSLSQSKIGRQQNSTLNAKIRNDEIFWLEENSANDNVSSYFAALNDLKLHLNQTLFLGLMRYEAHFAAYQPGSFYKKHVDQFKSNQDRKISCVYYLNTEWEPEFGGELILYDQEDVVLERILPTANRLVCFTSDMPHEVLTTRQHTRYSIAGWFKTRPDIF